MNIHWIGVGLVLALTGARARQSTSGSGDAADAAASAKPSPAADDAAGANAAVRSGSRPAGRQGRRLVRVPAAVAGDLRQPAPAASGEFDPDGWRDALADLDLDRRERQFAWLVERAGSDGQVEQLIHGWATDGERLELAWTARMLLRELHRARAVAQRGPTRQHHMPAGLEARLNEILSGPALEGGPMVPPNPGVTDVPGQPRQKSFRIATGPDGIRVEVHLGTGQPGTAPEAEVQVFEAPDLGQLLERHPELARELGSVWFVPEGGPVSPDQLFGALGGQVRFSLAELWDGEPGTLRTDILGVQMREPEVAHAEGGVGLLVERVLPHTIAQAVALRRGDLLLELNGVVLESGEDVSRIVAGRVQGAALVIQFARDGALGTVTWKPAPGGDCE